jgi:hypothetical protein
MGASYQRLRLSANLPQGTAKPGQDGPDGGKACFKIKEKHAIFLSFS